LVGNVIHNVINLEKYFIGSFSFTISVFNKKLPAVGVLGSSAYSYCQNKIIIEAILKLKKILIPNSNFICPETINSRIGELFGAVAVTMGPKEAISTPSAMLGSLGNSISKAIQNCGSFRKLVRFS
jgi:hypothetical protein